MIDHISLRVRDLATAKTFYVQALAPIGYEVVMEFPEGFGMGTKGKPDFWVTSGGREGATTHIAFRSDDNEKVDAFHGAALAAGGMDNGAPGLRHEYHPSYYGAFVRDPDGNNVEAVCHAPEPEERGG
jgi:catechol 2,3-dioxygenase-like lactoylglutathione lyase family enzyme